MISKRRHFVWTMLAAFLLVMTHDLTPHSHTFFAATPSFSSDFSSVEGAGILEVLVELDLGADHLEHFAPGKGFSLHNAGIQDLEKKTILSLPEKPELFTNSGIKPFEAEPLFHPVFLSSQYLFRGPPASQA